MGVWKVFTIWNGLKQKHAVSHTQSDPRAWGWPPLSPGQSTLHTSLDPCSKVSHQAVPDNPPCCSSVRTLPLCSLCGSRSSSGPPRHIIPSYVFNSVVIICLPPQINIRCHLEKRNVEGHVDDGGLACQVSEKSLKTLSGPFITSNERFCGSF